jgi:hypothetical protein
MKTRLQRWPGNSTLRFSAPMLALSLFLVALPAGAATSFTTTNWVAAVPLPGIPCTNGLGQVYLKGNVHVHRVVSAEARIAGRLQAWMDLAYQTNGTAIFGGPAYGELGTWDAAGTNFTPSGGVWDLKYSGVAQADGSDQVHMVGYGIGGAIEGLRVEIRATKGPGAPFDPTVPYVSSSGTIKPAPVNTTNVVDNFYDNRFTWTGFGAGNGTFTAIETNQQLTLRGTWHSPTATLTDWTAWANPNRPWAVQSGQTIEARVDLVSLSQTATSALLAIYHQDGQAYALGVGTNSIAIWKQYLPGNACLRLDQVSIKTTNVVLSLALTPVGQNVVVTARVLDKDNGAVLYQGSIVDTPASDPTLTQAQVAQLTGGRLWQDIRTDPSGAPWTNGTAPLLGVFQDTDGTKPPAEATFDNLEFRTYEVPQVALERAVRFSWPDTGMSYLIEAAPTVQGPWLPFQDSVLPGMQQMTAPANGSMKFFRLIQAP